MESTELYGYPVEIYSFDLYGQVKYAEWAVTGEPLNDAELYDLESLRPNSPWYINPIFQEELR